MITNGSYYDYFYSQGKAGSTAYILDAMVGCGTM